METRALIIASLLVMLSVSLALASDKSLTYGKGKVQVYVFADFFCPSCQTLDKAIEKEVDRLIKDGVATYTYVPVTTSKQSLGMTVHLISLSDKKPYAEMLRLKKHLYRKAETRQVTMVEIAGWVDEAKARPNLENVRGYLQEADRLKKQYAITATPSAVIVTEDGAVVKLEGVPDIGKAIAELEN